MASMDRPNVIVTGSARGIGFETAKLLGESGMRVGCVDIDATAVVSAVDALRKQGMDAEPLVVDISSKTAVDEVFTGFLGDAPLHGLVNNAVYLRFQPFDEIGEDNIDRTIAVGLKGTFWCVQAALPALEKAVARTGGASIVNVSSGSAIQGTVGFSAYASLKAGLTGLTRQLAVELGKRGIRTNSVAPGPIATESALADPGKPSDWEQGAVKRTPLARLGRPEEVAAVIAFLISPASAWVNGQVISVDGGKSIAAHDLR